LKISHKADVRSAISTTQSCQCSLLRASAPENLWPYPQAAESFSAHGMPKVSIGRSNYEVGYWCPCFRYEWNGRAA